MAGIEARKAQVVEFSTKLRAAGIRKVSVSYSGYGDEGHSEDPQLQKDDDSPIERSALPQELAIEELGELLASFAPEGYEDGDGGHGTVTFDVETGKVRVEHNWCETVSREADPEEF